MNIKELKEKIANLPDHMDVFIEQTDLEYPKSMAQNADVKELVFQDGRLKAKDECFVITDEF
jgi:hypothetical protein